MSLRKLAGHYYTNSTSLGSNFSSCIHKVLNSTKTGIASISTHQTSSSVTETPNATFIKPAHFEMISWSEFFSLRRRIQIIQRLAGIPFVFAFWAAEGFVLSLPIFDPTRTILEMDPMVVVGLASMTGSIASYFIGASFTGYVWRFFRSNLAHQLDQKQKNFYARISKYRANVPPNPTQLSFNFDYYGEKVRSVADYRAWLRRQRRLIADRQFVV